MFQALTKHICVVKRDEGKTKMEGEKNNGKQENIFPFLSFK